MTWLLLRIGIVRRRHNGSLCWPVYILPWRVWRAHWWPVVGKREAYVGLFRNKPGVIKWLPGSLLPRRWGFYILGIEIGQRG